MSVPLEWIRVSVTSPGAVYIPSLLTVSGKTSQESEREGGGDCSSRSPEITLVTCSVTLCPGCSVGQPWLSDAWALSKLSHFSIISVWKNWITRSQYLCVSNLCYICPYIHCKKDLGGMHDKLWHLSINRPRSDYFLCKTTVGKVHRAL